jgi:hypothetical protein
VVDACDGIVVPAPPRRKAMTFHGTIVLAAPSGESALLGVRMIIPMCS